MMTMKPTKSRAKTPTAADLSDRADRRIKRPHPTALKYKMTKLSHQRLSPHSHSPSDDDTKSPRSHLHAATADFRKFRNTDLQRISRRTSVSSSSIDADDDDDDEDNGGGYGNGGGVDAEFSGTASSAVISSITEDLDERGIMSDPGIEFMSGHERGHRGGGHQQHESKVLVVDNLDDFDSPQKGVFVDRPDSDDLFGADIIDDFVMDIINDNRSATNGGGGGRITPPAVITPSAVSSEVTPFSSIDAAKRISSVQPNLKSVPETQSEKTDSAL